MATSIENYGVAKGIPRAYTFQTREEDNKSPHLYLYYTISSDGTYDAHEAAINIKSGDPKINPGEPFESRLAFWTVSNFTHPITNSLSPLALGFKSLASSVNHDDLALDYIRDTYFDRASVRILPHDELGADNDILDALPSLLDRAIEQKAKVYIWGSEYTSRKGIHNVHMNQGSPGKFREFNGIWQDGALVFEFENHFEAVFIGFASQAVQTDQKGHPVGSKTWGSTVEE
jgi:uncharacterized protein YukJ